MTLLKCWCLPCAQLAALTGLRDLALHEVKHGPQGYQVLAQLGGCLERLRLVYVDRCAAAAAAPAATLQLRPTAPVHALQRRKATAPTTHLASCAPAGFPTPQPSARSRA